MSGINRAILIGNLGADPETRFTQAGSPVTNFRIATSEKWKDKQSGQAQERTEWHSIVAFGRLAEIAGEYLRKGSKVFVEGALRTSSWESDGQTRYKTEIIVSNLQMLDGKASGGEQAAGQQQSAQQRSGPAQTSRPAPQQSVDDFSDDIPF